MNIKFITLSFSAAPIAAKWDWWGYPGNDECLSDYAVDSPYMYRMTHDYNYTLGDYVYNPSRSMTVKECQEECENNDYCSGIIIDEYLPGACWHSSSYYDFWNAVSPEIGSCGYGAYDYCVSCNNTYRLQYWNLTERAGKILFNIFLIFCSINF